MKALLSILCLCFSLFAQSPDSLPLLRTFLQLSESQLERIMSNNQEHARSVRDRFDRISDLNLEITNELARENPDPGEVGKRVVEIERLTRSVRDEERQLRLRNVELLNEAQRARLRTVEDAVRLLPFVTEAQEGHLIDPSAILGRSARTARAAVTGGH